MVPPMDTQEEWVSRMLVSKDTFKKIDFNVVLNPNRKGCLMT